MNGDCLPRGGAAQYHEGMGPVGPLKTLMGDPVKPYMVHGDPID